MTDTELPKPLAYYSIDEACEALRTLTASCDDRAIDLLLGQVQVLGMNYETRLKREKESADKARACLGKTAEKLRVLVCAAGKKRTVQTDDVLAIYRTAFD